MPNKLKSLIDHLFQEVYGADKVYGPPASAHESYGVLAEEVAELLDAIRANQRLAVAHEALQVAAVAIRLALHCEDDSESDHSAFRQRSGFKT